MKYEELGERAGEIYDDLRKGMSKGMIDQEAEYGGDGIDPHDEPALVSEAVRLAEKEMRGD